MNGLVSVLSRSLAKDETLVFYVTATLNSIKLLLRRQVIALGHTSAAAVACRYEQLTQVLAAAILFIILISENGKNKSCRQVFLIQGTMES
jgi:hypothetical protein